MKIAELVKRRELTGMGCGQVGESWTLHLDGDQRITASNAYCKELLACEPSRLLGRHLSQVLDAPQLYSLIQQGFCFQSLPLQLNERDCTAEFCPAQPAEGGSGGDLTISLADPLQDTPKEMHDFMLSIDPLAEASQEGIIVVDRSGLIVMINQAFADSLGLQAREMLGRHVHDSYPNSSLSRLPKVMETGKAEVGEPHLLNGQQVVVSRWPLSKNGKTVGALGKILFKDAREVSRLAEKLQSGSGKALRGQKRQEFLYDANDIICQGPGMTALKEKLLRIAARPSAVLLSGESGTGKELFAHALHAASARCNGPFVRVNCAAIPEHLLESELFGYVEGAFTGAKRGGHSGKFEQAHGGTIFLDEISDMSVAMQAKLLRVLQEKELTPLGGSTTRFVDVRVIAATNADLQQQLKAGKFRADLYYRINVVNLAIPPLRERPEDTYQIAKHFIEHFNQEFELAVQGLETQAWAALRAYDFPGNVRELRSAIESAFNLVTGPFIRLEDLPGPIAQSLQQPQPVLTSAPVEITQRLGRQTLVEIMEELEKDLIEKTLEKAGGNKLNAANLLGISRPGLYKKLQKYHLH